MIILHLPMSEDPDAALPGAPPGAGAINAPAPGRVKAEPGGETVRTGHGRA